MSEPIEPALTPEGWGYRWVDPDGRIRVSNTPPLNGFDGLLEQPFTWEDVDALREVNPEHREGCAQQAFVGAACDCEAHDEAIAIASIADRIAARLPPRDP